MSGNNNEYGFGSHYSGGVSYEDNTPSPSSNTQPELESAPNLGQQTLQASSGPTAIKDITTAQFMPEVIQESSRQPVLVDFWAPWCEPCKQLAPALERAVSKAGDKIKLVKMDIEAHPEVAGQMGIKSVPAVVAFVDGQPKDAFMGVQSEAEIDQFIEKLVGPSGPSPLEQALEQADELMQQEAFEQASQLYGAILQQDPENIDASAGYGMAAFKMDNVELAKEILHNIKDDGNHLGLKALKSAIELHEQAEEIGSYSELEALLEKDPKNHQARFDLALALNCKVSAVTDRETRSRSLFSY